MILPALLWLLLRIWVRDGNKIRHLCITRAPMGARFSLAPAHVLACALSGYDGWIIEAWDRVDDGPMTYVDNILFLEQWWLNFAEALCTGAGPVLSSSGGWRPADVWIGVLWRADGAWFVLPQKRLVKIAALAAPGTWREVLQAVGRFISVLYTLQLPMAAARPLLPTLRAAAREELGLDEPARLTPQVTSLLAAVAPLFGVPRPRRLRPGAEDGRLLLAMTDAGEWGWGCVLKDPRSGLVTLATNKWSREMSPTQRSINSSETWAMITAVLAAISLRARRLHVYTDSGVGLAWLARGIPECELASFLIMCARVAAERAGLSVHVRHVPSADQLSITEVPQKALRPECWPAMPGVPKFGDFDWLREQFAHVFELPLNALKDIPHDGSVIGLRLSGHPHVVSRWYGGCHTVGPAGPADDTRPAPETVSDDIVMARPQATWPAGGLLPADGILAKALADGVEPPPRRGPPPAGCFYTDARVRRERTLPCDLGAEAAPAAANGTARPGNSPESSRRADERGRRPVGVERWLRTAEAFNTSL